MYQIQNSKLSCIDPRNNYQPHIYQNAQFNNENTSNLNKVPVNKITCNEYSNKDFNDKKPKRFRTTFTRLQLVELEKEFNQDKYLNSNRVKEIGTKLSLGALQIKVWFKNRRRKCKIKEKENLLNSQMNDNIWTDNNDSSRMILPMDNINFNNVCDEIQVDFISNSKISSNNDIDNNNNNDGNYVNNKFTYNKMMTNDTVCSTGEKCSAHKLSVNNFLTASNEYTINQPTGPAEYYTDIIMNNKNNDIDSMYYHEFNNWMNYQNHLNMPETNVMYYSWNNNLTQKYY